jgi:hemerythrin
MSGSSTYPTTPSLASKISHELRALASPETALLAVPLPKDNVAVLAVELYALWIDHLINEEDFMEKVKFPYWAPHKTKHLQLTHQFQELKDKINQDSSYDSSWLVHNLEILLKQHIDSAHMQYSDWI